MSSQTAKPRARAADLIMRAPLLKKVIERLGRSSSPIFGFHRVLPEGTDAYHTDMITSSGVFAALLDWISDRYQVIPLADLVRLRRRYTNEGKPFCALTFDDGWRDNFLYAFPMLRERQLPATVFVCVRFIGTNRRFWQERLWFGLRSFSSKRELREAVERVVSSLPWCRRIAPDRLMFDYVRRFLLDRPSAEAEEFVDRLSGVDGCSGESDARAFLSWDEVRVMQESGVTFGSHTLNHTLLSHTDPAAAYQEIEGSRQELAEHLGSPPESIAYPWGATATYTRGQVKATGYTIGLTIATGLIDNSSDPLLLPRLVISDSSVCGTEHNFHSGKSCLMMARCTWHPKNGRNQTKADNRIPQKRIRIGFVIDSIHSWRGGTEQQLRTMIHALDRNYFEPELYFLCPSDHLRPEDFPCPLHVLARRGKLKWYQTEALRNLVQLLRTRRPHIIQTFFRDATYYGALAANIARIPIVIVSVRNAGYWKSATDRVPLRIVRLLTDAWQCNSRPIAEALQLNDYIRAEQIEVLPNSIDLSRFAPATPGQRLQARQQLDLPPEAPVFVSVANLRPVKDLETLIQAVRCLQNNLPAAHFLLVGDGPLRQSLESEVARLGLSSLVRFLGDMVDVHTCLAAADIGLLTSRSEASSNSVLEYMAMGLPAVVTDIPGNRDLVDRVFFRAGAPDDLAAKILEVWNNSDLRVQMRAEYRRRAMKYGVDTFATRVQSYYSSLTGSMLEHSQI